jgi:hypothetical protein
MREDTVAGEAPFGVAAGEILGRELSGGRLASEEVARLLALEIGAHGLVICVRRRDSGRTKLAAVWALDRYSQERLKRNADGGLLCDVIERHRETVEVGATAVWGFDATEVRFTQGLAIPLSDQDVEAMVCGLFDEDEPDANRAVAVASQLAPFLSRLTP